MVYSGPSSLLFLGKGVRAHDKHLLIVSTQKNIGLLGLSYSPVPAAFASGGCQAWSAGISSDLEQVTSPYGGLGTSSVEWGCHRVAVRTK